MRIEAELDPVHSTRLNELVIKLNQPTAEILAVAIDRLYQQESFDSKDKKAILRRIKSRFARIPAGVSLADELIAERRQESARENP